MAINFDQVDQAVRDGHKLNDIIDTMNSQGLDTSSIPMGNYDEMSRAIRDGHSMADIASHMQQTTPSLLSQQPPAQRPESNQIVEPSMEDQTFSLTQPGMVQPADTMTTMTPEQIDASALATEQTAAIPETIQTGVAQGAAGIIQTGHDLLNLAGIETDSTENQEVIKLLDKEIKAYEEKYGEGFNMADTGRLLWVAPTLPVAYVSKLVGMSVEGLIGYAESRGVGSEKGKAFVDGLIAAGLTGGVMLGLDKLSGKYAKTAYDEVVDRFHYTEESAEKVCQNWKEVMGDSGNEFADRTKALLDHADKNNFSLGELERRAALTTDSNKIGKSIETEIKGREDAIKKLSSNRYTKFEDAAHDIKRVNDQIKDDYQYVKESIAPKEIKNNFTTDGLPEGEVFENLPDYMRSDVVELRHLAKNQNPTVADLLDASKAVNSLLSRPSYKGTTKGYNIGQIKGQINKALKENLHPEEFKKWMTINSDYRKMKVVQNSKLGQSLEQIIGVNAKADSKTIGEFLDSVPNMTGSRETFSAIEHLIGTKKATQLENKIVDTMVDKVDSFNWEKLNSAMGKKGFVTPSGKALQDLSTKLSESFKNDHTYRALLEDVKVHEGAKTKVDAAMAAFMVDKFVQMAVKVTPTAAGKAARQTARISKILSNPNNVKKIEEAIDGIGLGVRQQLIREAVQQVKQLEYKPGAAPLYATEKGAVGPTPSATKLAEDQDTLIRDFIDKNTNPEMHAPDTVVENVHKIATDKRLTSVMNNVSKKMAVEDAEANAKMLKKIIQSESEALINRMQKDLGVKLPKEEADKIVKAKMQKLLEDCDG